VQKNTQRMPCETPDVKSRRHPWACLIRITTAFVVLATLVSLSWLMIMPRDFSTADVVGNPDGRNPYTGWRPLLLLVSLFGLAFDFAFARILSVTATVVGITFTSVIWYGVRSSAAQTSGANMWIVGLVMFTPIFAAVSAVGHLCGSWGWRSRKNDWPRRCA
jgi:hypothetical protein